jgi:hypothetical protein
MFYLVHNRLTVLEEHVLPSTQFIEEWQGHVTLEWQAHVTLECQGQFIEEWQGHITLECQQDVRGICIRLINICVVFAKQRRTCFA